MGITVLKRTQNKLVAALAENLELATEIERIKAIAAEIAKETAVLKSENERLTTETRLAKRKVGTAYDKAMEFERQLNEVKLDLSRTLGYIDKVNEGKQPEPLPEPIYHSSMAQVSQPYGPKLNTTS